MAAVGDAWIDGADEQRSGLARWINHSQRGENLYWRKQRFGPNAPAMHFYAKRRIAAGEELLFDYGRDYWDALDEPPVEI